MAKEAEVKLFTTRISPYGQRVQVALSEKGIPFELILVDLANKPKELLEANPIFKKVPTIIHNGKPVAESQVILQYIEDVWPEQVPLLPKDAYEKSQARFWSDYIYKGFTTVGESIMSKSGAPEKEAAKEGIVKFMKTLDVAMTNYSAVGPFFAGNKFGFLDMVLAPITSRLALLETMGGVVLPGPNEIPRFHKWVEVMKARPSVTATIASAEETGGILVKLSKLREGAARR